MGILSTLLHCMKGVKRVSKTEELVFAIAEPFAKEAGVEIYDVEYKKEGKDWFLRVFLYSEKGITIDDCEAVSRKLSDELDRIDPIDTSYCLEVSSPGIDRILKRDRHFESAIGEKIDIKFFAAVDGKKKMSGILCDYKNGKIYFTEEETGKNYEIEKKELSQARVSFE